jgi:hypothetical protein
MSSREARQRIVTLAPLRNKDGKVVFQSANVVFRSAKAKVVFRSAK